MSSSLAELGSLGQSVWLDSISRDWLDSGELARMVEELSITGVTSNPSIFAQALRSSAYDTEITELVAQGLDDRTVFEHIAVRDIRDACDVMRDAWKRSRGVDGMVSIELEPDLAHDVDGSIERARHLWKAVGRSNVMIKVPATAEGLDVLEQLIVDGINVNVTLLFAVSTYVSVVDRYLRGLERRAAAGEDLAVHSVASFFVSRVDSRIDTLLEERPEHADLRGRVAVANAIAAWEAYLNRFTSDRFLTLQRGGARPQRPLWASTGTKNPAYSDVLYVQDLIVPGSVNTMPLSTMQSFAGHGSAHVTINEESRRTARTVLGELRGTGIDLQRVTDELLIEGLASFSAAYEEILARIAERRATLTGS